MTSGEVSTCFYRHSCLLLWYDVFGIYKLKEALIFDQFGEFLQSAHDFPSAGDCSNLTETFTALASSLRNETKDVFNYSTSTFPTVNMAACQIVCGETDPRTLFKSLGASSPMATGMCIFVVTLLVLSSLYLLAAILQHEAQWIPTLGSLTMSTGFAFFVVLYSGTSEVAMYNPHPVIAAMNAAIFSYFFSGFQYAISPGYEFGPAVSLLAVGYPLWLDLVAFPYKTAHRKSFPVLLARIGLAMPIVSFIWIIHSALYRTIGYRAAWIRAWRLYHHAPADISATPRYNLWVFPMDP